MLDSVSEAGTVISLEDAARRALELAARRDLESALSGFLELVQSWARPSAVLAAAVGAESGWRLLPALCVGLGPAEAAALLGRTVETVPEAPVLQTGEAPPGVEVRDHWVLPWWHEGESGVLLLRSVPRDAAPNLGPALAVIAAPLWPRLLGSPAARLEGLLADVQRAAGLLEREAAKQAERLLRAVPPPDPAEETRLSDLEAAAAAAREEARQAGTLQLEAQARVTTAEEALRLAQAERDAARAEAAAARGERDAAQAERDATRAEVGRQRASLEQAGARQAAVEEQVEEARRALLAADARAQAARDVEGQRDLARAEAERLTARVEQLAAQQAASASQMRELQQAVEAARAAAAEHARQSDEARRALAERESQPAAPPAALAEAVAALRRTPYVSPALREALEAAGGPRPARPDAWLDVAMLDREPRPEALIAELEAQGLRLRVAHHPEELAILVRSPEGRGLDALICDVMSFRPHDNVAGLFRAWEKDKAGLLFFLSFSTTDPAEVERAKRVPLSLLAGHVQRPIKAAALIETLQILARKLGKLPAEKA